MNPVYCSQGNENPEGSRFCLHNGDNLGQIQNLQNQYIPVSQGIQSG
ncbi:hypothetical protein RintRC_3356 [Richelia intracellularis]|nr:hypothetical protein RintRC_3356 [Richelia intracellularis]